VCVAFRIQETLALSSTTQKHCNSAHSTTELTYPAKTLELADSIGLGIVLEFFTLQLFISITAYYFQESFIYLVFRRDMQGCGIVPCLDPYFFCVLTERAKTSVVFGSKNKPQV